MHDPSSARPAAPPSRPGSGTRAVRAVEVAGVASLVAATVLDVVSRFAVEDQTLLWPANALVAVAVLITVLSVGRTFVASRRDWPAFRVQLAAEVLTTLLLGLGAILRVRYREVDQGTPIRVIGATGLAAVLAAMTTFTTLTGSAPTDHSVEQSAEEAPPPPV